jgi:hypothetical protein
VLYIFYDVILVDSRDNTLKAECRDYKNNRSNQRMLIVGLLYMRQGCKRGLEMRWWRNMLKPLLVYGRLSF